MHFTGDELTIASSRPSVVADEGRQRAHAASGSETHILCDLQGFEQALADAIAANGGRGLRSPPASEVKRVLDAAAELRAPGRLVLRSERLRRELDALAEDPGADTPSAAAGDRSKGTPAGPAGKDRKRVAKAGVTQKHGQHGSASLPTIAKSAKRRKKDRDAGGSHAGIGAERGAADSEPQVLNRQQVQPNRPLSRAVVADPDCSGTEAGSGAAGAYTRPPVRWDLDVAAALGIGGGGGGSAGGGLVRGGSGARSQGVSPSAATSGAWASTSFARSGSLAEDWAVHPSAGPMSAMLPHSRSLSAASVWGSAPGEDTVPASQQQQRQQQQPAGVQRLKIRLRVPPGASAATTAPSADGGSGSAARRQSSGSGGRSARGPYDDSWFAEHVDREPRRAFSIQDEAQVRIVLVMLSPSG